MSILLHILRFNYYFTSYFIQEVLVVLVLGFNEYFTPYSQIQLLFYF